jgi:hypothetical protein
LVPGEGFPFTVTGVISVPRHKAIPWLAINVVDWYSFPREAPDAPALTCTDIARQNGFPAAGLS